MRPMNMDMRRAEMRSGGTRICQFKGAAPVTACGAVASLGRWPAQTLRASGGGSTFEACRTPLAALVALGLIGSACNHDDDESAVCQPKDRTTLLSTRIKFGDTSEPFTMPDDDAVFIGLIADSEYSAGSMFARLASLTVSPADDVSDKKRTEGFDFEREGQFHRLSIPPGSYRITSGRAPEIAVVSCSTG